LGADSSSACSFHISSGLTFFSGLFVILANLLPFVEMLPRFRQQYLLHLFWV
jgi:hypothetical protein